MKTQIILALFVFGALAQYHLQPQCNVGLPGLSTGLTEDFQNWLSANGYSQYPFLRSDLQGGSFGGRTSANQTLNNTPIIFIHGNSDIAVGNGTLEYSWQTGFRDLIQYAISQGYNSAELYITTWGPADPSEADDQTHSFAYVNYLRQFTNAVLNYTGATSVNFVAHSMGVTLARKVIKGGNLTDSTGTHYVGDSLNSMVDNFIALAGANWGLQTCEYLDQYPTCGQSNGFYPGTAAGSNGIPTGLGAYLEDVNVNGGKEADFIASLWNYPFDSIIGMETLYNHNTSQIAYEDATKPYNGFEWTHFDIRDGTCSTVLAAIKSQSLSDASDE